MAGLEKISVMKKGFVITATGILVAGYLPAQLWTGCEAREGGNTRAYCPTETDIDVELAVGTYAPYVRKLAGSVAARG